MHRPLFFCNYWVTLRCNSRCQYCNFWRDPTLKGMPDASLKDVKRNLDDLQTLGTRIIDFTGGEPLLHPQLPEMLAYAKDCGFFVKLATNGLLYPEKAEEIAGLPSRLYISLDTLSPEEYHQIRGVPGLPRVLESIQIAKQHHQELCLFYTVTNENIANIPAIAQFARETRTTVYLHPCFSYFHNPAFAPGDITKITKWFWHPYLRMSLPHLAFHRRGGNSLQHPSCLIGDAVLDIGPDDCLMTPCFHHAIKKEKINGHLLAMHNSPLWQELYGNVGRYPFCQHCSIDCYFGLSYWDRVGVDFFRQNLSVLKDLVESTRPH